MKLRKHETWFTPNGEEYYIYDIDITNLKFLVKDQNTDMIHEVEFKDAKDWTKKKKLPRKSLQW